MKFIDKIESVTSNDSTKGVICWIDFIVIPSKITNSRKEKSNSYADSLHKQQKCGIHRTINGKGVVGRLFKKR